MARGYILDKGKPREILLAIAILGGAFMIPGAARAMYSLVARKIAGEDTPEERAIKARRLKELAQRRLITIRDISGSKIEVTLTGAGKKLVKLYELDNMKLPKPPKWDRRWRIITYDIPKKKQKASLALSRKFHELGMFRLQRSIWIYPHECKDDIDTVCAIFDINPDDYVLYLTSDRIPREADARKHFDMALA
jgi:DNA-binding transcriptional regulator PaaX